MGQILHIVPGRRAGDRIRDRLMLGLEDAVAALLIVSFAVGCLFGVMMAFISPRPLLSMSPLAVLILFLSHRLWTSMRSAQRFQTGIRGEVLVGEALDHLRSDGAAVFHGVFPSDEKIGDIDHIVIHPAGVFVVETKARSGKPGRAKPKIFVIDGEVQTQFGDPCRQARRCAGWLSKHLQQTTGQDTFVMPMVVYPGCEIITKGAWRTPVLDALGLVKHVKGLPRRLSESDIRTFKKAIGLIEQPVDAIAEIPAS
ncbi:MAG: nuclease-related domain-containing protein [Pseudomonadota bacterium]